VNRKTVYATLQRWAEEEFAGLPDKSKARKGPRKVTLKVRNELCREPGCQPHEPGYLSNHK